MLHNNLEKHLDKMFKQGKLCWWKWLILVEIYLFNQKVYLKMHFENTSVMLNTCYLFQKYWLRPFLLLIYVNDLTCASGKLVSVMFTNDINLTCSHYNIKVLFNMTYNETGQIRKSFRAKLLWISKTL